MKPEVKTGELLLFRGRTLAWLEVGSVTINAIPFPDGLAHPISREWAMQQELVGHILFRRLDGSIGHWMP